MDNKPQRIERGVTKILLSLQSDVVRELDVLVSNRRFHSRSEMLREFIRDGIDKHNQIERQANLS